MDTAARFGGDEFALVLPETGATAAKLVATRICERLVRDGGKPQLSVTIGTAVYPADGQTIATLLGAADAALYSRKGLARSSCASTSKNSAAPHDGDAGARQESRAREKRS
jgi:diguanylate cyclase (GGDEF)-like protein